MIITDDSDKNHEPPKAVVGEQTPQDPPPTYTSIQPTSAPLPLPGSFPSNTPSNVVNHVYISRHHGQIKETLTIDPSLYIPQFFHAPLAKRESESLRDNVRLETVHGEIEADVTLIQGNLASAASQRQRTTLQFASTHGGIKVTIPDHPSRPPFLLTAKSNAGNCRLILPRSFTGPVTVSYVHGAVNTSALGRHFITLGEANGVMKGFIGDLSRYTEYDEEGKSWKGDELVVSLKHGSVKLRFYQERDAKNSVTAGEGDSQPTSLKNRT